MKNWGRRCPVQPHPQHFCKAHTKRPNDKCRWCGRRLDSPGPYWPGQPHPWALPGRRPGMFAKLANPSAAWLAVDCEQCNAKFGEPCRTILPRCKCDTCKALAISLERGESYHCGGARERAELGIQI